MVQNQKVNLGVSVSLQLSQQLDGLLGMLCADVAPADGASIQQNLKLLEEKLQTVGSFSAVDVSRALNSSPSVPLFRERHCPTCSRCRGRPVFSASEGDDGAGADVRPAAVDPGGGRESRRGAAGQRAARPGRHGGDAAPEAEVTKVNKCTIFFSRTEKASGMRVEMSSRSQKQVKLT